MLSTIQDAFIQEVLFFLKGAIAGVAVSAPVGPASLVCIRRTLNYGFLTGILSGLGICLADCFYGGLVSIGLTSIISHFTDFLEKMRGLCGILLVIFGVILILKKNVTQKGSGTPPSRLKTIASPFFITIANPITLILFAAIFTALGIKDISQDFDLVLALILGIAGGAMGWWFLLCGTMSLFHKSIGPLLLGWTNRITGGMFMGFGVYIVWNALAGILSNSS